MVSRQEALFGIEKITYARMVDTAQHLHLVRKLGKGARGRGIGCGFFKIFTKHEPQDLEMFLGKRECTGKTINAGKKSRQGSMPYRLKFKTSVN